MSKDRPISVAVTAAGGGVGQSILKSLKDTDYRTVAIDPSEQAAGLYMADAAYLGKNFDDPGFIERLIEICRAENCKYLFPGFDAELRILSEKRDEFKTEGITVIVSDPSVIDLSDSKKNLMDFLSENSLGPITTMGPYNDVTKIPFIRAGDFIIKPDNGCRSQGVHFVKIRFSQDGKKATMELTGNDMRISTTFPVGPDNQYCYFHIKAPFIVQEEIEGPEYTCGTVSFHGDVLGVIAMTRELRSGDTYKAKVDQNPIILKYVTDLIRRIKPFGPCNVQLRFRKGVPYVLEINARCSGTTGARTLAGFNEPEMVLNHLEGLPVEHNIEPIEILRYWDEVVVRPEDKERIHP